MTKPSFKGIAMPQTAVLAVQMAVTAAVVTTLAMLALPVMVRRELAEPLAEVEVVAPIRVKELLRHSMVLVEAAVDTTSVTRKAT